MKGFTRTISLLLLAGIILTGMLTGCATTPASTTPTGTVTQITTPAPTAITITDHYNRTVIVKMYPQRIISLSPANTEILFALGLGDRIVGVSEYSNYPPEASNITSVGAYDKPNVETIISLEPDLVLATEEHEAEMAQLESHGITVVGLNPKSVNEVLSTIILIGHITGADKEAAALYTDMQQRINTITQKTGKLTDEQRPRVFYIIWHDPIWTVGSATFHDELIRMAGGVNIAANLTGYAAIGLESVIAANPQVIIAGVGMGTGENLPLQFVQTDSRLSGVDARNNNTIFSADMDIVSRPGPRLVDALEVFFKLIHPELQ
jgi:iron complex transport system substrate-binding protein